MGAEKEPGITLSRMRQVLHTFHVNHNLQDICQFAVAGRTSEIGFSNYAGINLSCIIESWKHKNHKGE